MRGFSERHYARILKVGTSWRDLSADQALRELKNSVIRAQSDATGNNIIDAVLWYWVVMELLDDRDDLDQMWKKLRRYQILPAEWPLWQRYTSRALRL